MKKYYFGVFFKLFVILPLYSQSRNYTSLGSFNDGIAPAILDNKLGYINTKGETVIPFIFDNRLTVDEQRFNKKNIYLCLNGKCGVMNLKKDTIVPFRYDLIRTKNGFNFDNPNINNVIVSIYRTR